MSLPLPGLPSGPRGPGLSPQRRRLVIVIGAALTVITLFAFAAPSCGGDAPVADPGPTNDGSPTTASTAPPSESPDDSTVEDPAAGGPVNGNPGEGDGDGSGVAPGATVAPPPGTDPLDAPLADPDATGRDLVNRFADILSSPDPRPRLEEFLSPAFQLQRSNGTFANRDEYLAQPPTISRFTIVDEGFRATQDGRVLTVRLRVEVVEPGNAGPLVADRLGVFVRSTAGWRMAAWANFNPVNP
jgi:hypothetical protein